MAFVGFGLGLILPSTMTQLTLIAEGIGDQARLGGLGGFAQGMGLVIGPVLGVLTYKVNGLAPFLLGAALLTIVCGWRTVIPPQIHAEGYAE